MPDRITYSAAARACERVSLWEHAVALFTCSRAHDVQVGEGLIMAIVSACDKSGEWERALSWLARASQLGLGLASGVAINAGLSACARASQWACTLALLATLRWPRSPAASDAGPAVSTDPMCSPGWPARSSVSYTTAISACERASLWLRCLSLLDEMWSVELVPELTDYRCTVRACGHGGQWQTAMGLLATMRCRRLSDRRGSVWSAATWACEAAHVFPPIPPGAAASASSIADWPLQGAGCVKQLFLATASPMAGRQLGVTTSSWNFSSH